MEPWGAGLFLNVFPNVAYLNSILMRCFVDDHRIIDQNIHEEVFQSAVALPFLMDSKF